MHGYDHKRIEKKWQKVWQQQRQYEAKDASPKKKFYALIEFPYPSGEGLHVGHPRPYIGMDIIARKRRMEGYNVLYPIGWDAFGLPTENYAVKTGIHPALVTKRNTKNFKRQIQMLAISFDWSREINTTDPSYYKWTQWMFLLFFKKGLAYKKKMPINWCLSCRIGLANEEVVDGTCERCGGETERREKEQWMLAITKYADRLDKDLDMVDYPSRIKAQQRNWIGKSNGSLIKFSIFNFQFSKKEEKIEEVEVFTTRPDTLFGVTYLVLSPEHPVLKNIESRISNLEEVRKYQNEAKRKTEIERTGGEKEKTGVELKGIKAINPANQDEIPIWIADYVLSDYGTGAIMAVPAHDVRDFQFISGKGLPLIEVIDTTTFKLGPISTGKGWPYTGTGKLINSGEFSGMDSEEAKKKITEFVGGKIVTTYKLRDWVFSRQRYWGEPIPVIHCERCGTVPVPEKDLPVKLPEVKNYAPTDTGESPLAAIESWVNVKCPKCKGPARRETDTMPNWAGSSWYYIAYCISENLKSQLPISKQFPSSKIQKKLKHWLPVDWYNGGMEHTTLHLLYSRFWHKFLYDCGLVPTLEPYAKRTSHGLILAEGGEKMSKSKGNVVNPDAVVKSYGADSLRVYEMFMGPFEQAISWNTDSLIGSRRFLERVWKVGFRIKDLGFKKKEISSPEPQSAPLTALLHHTIKKVGEDIELLKFNTALSSLMILLNAFEREASVSLSMYKTFLKLLAPFAPHMAEEVWANLGSRKSIHLEPWPAYEEKALTDTPVTIIAQVNGKTRGSFETSRGRSKEELGAATLALPSVKKWLDGKEVRDVIVVQDRLVNVVVS